jgi:hypothetical protein
VTAVPSPLQRRPTEKGQAAEEHAVGLVRTTQDGSAIVTLTRALNNGLLEVCYGQKQLDNNDMRALVGVTQKEARTLQAELEAMIAD